LLKDTPVIRECAWAFVNILDKCLLISLRWWNHCPHSPSSSLPISIDRGHQTPMQVIPSIPHFSSPLSAFLMKPSMPTPFPHHPQNLQHPCVRGHPFPFHSFIFLDLFPLRPAQCLRLHASCTLWRVPTLDGYAPAPSVRAWCNQTPLSITIQFGQLHSHLSINAPTCSAPLAKELLRLLSLDLLR